MATEKQVRVVFISACRIGVDDFVAGQRASISEEVFLRAIKPYGVAVPEGDYKAPETSGEELAAGAEAAAKLRPRAEVKAEAKKSEGKPADKK